MTLKQNDSAEPKPKTRRQVEKEQRYRALLRAAGRLFGTHGYAAVTLDDIGTEVGVSGQAIYRHFRGKQDLLGKLLVEVSSQLLEGGRLIQSEHPVTSERIDRLISFHVDFALASPEVIRVQEQEMPQLRPEDRQRVRQMQRQYLDIWGEAVSLIHPGISDTELRTRLHGVFGLINSTARSIRRSGRAAAPAGDARRSAATLHTMARAAVESRISSGEGPRGEA